MTVTCFCPGCKTGYRSEIKANKLKGIKSPSLFTIPKDPALFQLWQRVIPRTDRLLKPSDRVCARHFKIEDIRYHGEPIKLFDGSVYVPWLHTPRLKKGAVPSIFSDVPGHSTYIPKIIPSEKTKCSKRESQSVAICQLKVQKTKEVKAQKFNETRTTETENECFSSKEKENVLKTDFSLLPSFFLNCLTSSSQSDYGTLNKINTHESGVLILQGHVGNNTLKENISLNKSDYSSPVVSNVPELCPESNLSNNLELISSTPNSDCNVTLRPREAHKSPEIIKDFPTNSQRIVQLSSFQSNSIHSEGTHRYSNISNSAVGFTENFVPSNHSYCSTKSYVILQPLDTQNVLATEPDVIKESSNSSNLIEESKNLSHPLNEAVAAEVIQQHSDTNIADPPISLKDSEIDVDIPLSIAKKQFCFKLLKKNAHKIDKLNSWWKVSAFDDFFLCARWNSDCLVERRIIVTRDLKVKVFLKDKETNIGNNLETISVDTISQLIFRVERTKLCPNILKKGRNCSGYLETHYLCKRWNVCRNCVKWQRLKEEEKELEEQNKKFLKIKQAEIQLNIDV